MFSIKGAWFLREKAKSGKQQSDSKHTRHTELSWPTRPLNKNIIGVDDNSNFTWHINNETSPRTSRHFANTLHRHLVVTGIQTCIWKRVAHPSDFLIQDSPLLSSQRAWLRWLNCILCLSIWIWPASRLKRLLFYEMLSDLEGCFTQTCVWNRAHCCVFQWCTTHWLLSLFSAHHAALFYMPISGLSGNHRVSLEGAQCIFEHGAIWLPVWILSTGC